MFYVDTFVKPKILNLFVFFNFFFIFDKTNLCVLFPGSPKWFEVVKGVSNYIHRLGNEKRLSHVDKKKKLLSKLEEVILNIASTV